MQIRRAESLEDYQTVERIQGIIWGMQGENPVPVTILVAINNNGGLVEVAEEDGKIIGFSLAFPGTEGGYRFLYSHMAGVIREYRNRDVGLKIKMHQFEEARRMGYNEIRWTFDPLKSRNSYFNTHKLKAFAYNYKINYYGFMESEENRGIESDRIEAHKFLDKSPSSSENFAIGATVNSINQPWKDLRIEGDRIGVEIPMNLDDRETEVKKKWRLALRRAIIRLESKDYVMTDVSKKEETSFLIFSKREIYGLGRD